MSYLPVSGTKREAGGKFRALPIDGCRGTARATLRWRIFTDHKDHP
ncbi:hypothetical protein [Sphingomonas endolithica]|nr:hypothetical protein [Sphingomonas sp. ZFBP2030]